MTRKRYWLVKSEPGTYSIHDLERDGVTEWSGVRNYRARNLMRDEMGPGDGVLFYHSNADPLGVYGRAEVASPAHPDSEQFRRGSPYHDPAATRDDPRWWCVDIRHVETWPRPVTRDEMKASPVLRGMMLLRRGARLSVQPVAAEEYREVVRLARSR